MSTGTMDAFSLRDFVVEEYERFATSFTTIHATDLREKVEAIYAKNRYWPEPLIQVNPNYKRTKTVAALEADGSLAPGCAAVFPLQLFEHQTQAIALANQGKSYVVTTGIDLLYERLLTSGRAAPVITEGPDSVHVTVPRRVLHPAVIRLLEDADSRYQLTQRERIALGMLAQGDGLRAVEFAARLALEEVGSLRTWVARLLEVGLVEQTGRTQATRYFVPPVILQSAGLERKTNLSRVQPHRLKALILEHISRFPRSGRGDIHRRIGLEINVKAVSRALAELVGDGSILPEKDGRWRTYTLGPLRDGDHDR